LRVLGLHFYGIKELPFEPAFMKHLRYLDLSGSIIGVLPEGLSALYNLEALVLNNCCVLEYLPEGMKYMVSLRHVYLDGCQNLMCMPADLGQLNSLQTLTMYKVSNEPGHGIKELKNLKLGGKLHIGGLIKVNNPLEAKEADIVSKERIEQLELSWIDRWTTPGYSDYKFNLQVDISEEVLEALRSHNGLKVLKLEHYAGSQFPRWLTDGMKLYSLVELSLSSCINCTYKPSVSQLPHLEVLKMKHIKNLRYFCISNTVDGESNHPPMIFSKLKFLSLKKMELLMWEETEVREVSSVTFPLLDALKIIDCPKLKAFPHVPVLKSLTVKGNRTLIDLVAGITTVRALTFCMGHEFRGVKHYHGRSEGISH
jgi:Leucine-rich repeat (LRR) protein